MSVKYYTIPNIGSGHPSDSIRPDYVEGLQQLYPTMKLHRKIGDPFANLNGLGVYALIDLPLGGHSLLERYPGVSVLGETPQAVRDTLVVKGDARANQWLSKYPNIPLLADVLRIRTTPLNRPTGTDTTTWNDSDTTAWTALTANSLTHVDVTGGGSGSTTFDVLTNEGRALPVSGGGFYSHFELHHQTTDNAEDQTVELHHESGDDGLSRDWTMLAGRVVVGDTDTFFSLRCVDFGPTQLHEYVNGTANLLASSAANDVNPAREFKMVIATNGSNTDIDGSVWATGGGEPSPHPSPGRERDRSRRLQGIELA